MTTTKEQLELAAKAIGKSLLWTEGESGVEFCYIPDAVPPHNRRASDANSGVVWDPATDDGDSRRLECDLEIDTHFNDGYVHCKRLGTHGTAMSHDDTTEGRLAAVREAVLAVAAEVGRNMK